MQAAMGGRDTYDDERDRKLWLETLVNKLP